ncbi:MAG: TonB-dependent receptor [Candidatus Marinimicrobia bacterium]|nr:TonB-dependent receptor [Candidatus Neomarinimicrobiota bacterium]
MKKLTVLLFLPILMFAMGNVNGYLHDSATGEPLIYANVMLANTNYGTASDVHGYYVISGVPSGTYKLIVSMMGYEQVEKEITINGHEIREDFDIAPKAVEGEEVIVTAERMRFKEKVEISRTNLSFKEILSTPSFIEADVFRTIQQLPSVTSQNDFSSALIVRGGSPDENLILLDGAEIYNPYHLGGLFSTFNADAISDAEFLAGGYPAEYSGRLSSVLSITSREGNSRQGKFFQGSRFGEYFDVSRVKGEISLLSSKALAEGPFYKGAWILSGRRTYFDQIAALYNRTKGEDTDWKYFFWDNQFKIFSDLDKKNRVTFSTFNGRDVLKFNFDDPDWDEKINFDWDWGNNTASLKWRFVPNSKFYSEFMLTRSGFDFNVALNVTEVDSNGNKSETNFEIFNKIHDISATEKLTWFLNPEHTLTLGATVKKLTMAFNFELNNINYFDIKQKPDVFSAFIQDKWKINNLLTLQTGLRASKYELHDNVYLDPRFGFKYLLTENLSLKGSWGIFNQFIFTTNDDDEILKVVDFWQPVPKYFDAMTNQQFIVGMEKWFEQGFTGSVEAYYKPYSNVITNNPANDPALENDEFIEGEGRVWGLELLLKKTTGKFTGWIGYSYSDIEKRFDFNNDGKVEKTNNEMSEIFAPKYSKPHSFNLVANYQMNEKNQFSLSWSMSSGQPYTPVVGKVYDGGGDIDAPFANVVNLYGEQNSARYPLYMRGDIGWIRKISPFGIDGKFKFSIMNFTNHYNVLLYVWDHDEAPSKVRAMSMFPIIPSFGFEFEL